MEQTPVAALMSAICTAYAESQQWDPSDVFVVVAPNKTDELIEVWLGAVSDLSVFPPPEGPIVTAPTLEGALFKLAALVDEEFAAMVTARDALRAAMKAVPHAHD